MIAIIKHSANLCNIAILTYHTYNIPNQKQSLYIYRIHDYTQVSCSVILVQIIHLAAFCNKKTPDRGVFVSILYGAG